MSTVVRRGIYGKLSSDTTLNNLLATPPAGYAKSIFHQQAPEGAAYPFVVFSKSAGTPTYTLASDAFDSDVWLVKAVDKNTTADPAEAIQARIRSLLTDANLSISGEAVMWLRRESDVEYPEVIDGEQVHHAGDLWRLIHQAV